MKIGPTEFPNISSILKTQFPLPVLLVLVYVSIIYIAVSIGNLGWTHEEAVHPFPIVLLAIREH